MPHSSTESEIISLDAGLRMDGIPVLDLWDVANTNTPTPQKNSANKGRVKELRETAASTSNVKLRNEGNQDIDPLSNLEHVATDTNSSQCKAQQYIFESNEAVIKMFMKDEVQR